MCGIAGMVGRGAGDLALLQRITRTLTHRGPDGEGYWVSAEASLGMRRLSIIDVANGQQPYCNEDGTVIVVFNGEIYNYRELREHLEAAGHRLSSGADGEVISHLYEEDPNSFMDQLDGMFAIAIVDLRRHMLTLIRDRWGKKPLLYTELNGTLVFASEMRALLSTPFARREPDEYSIDAYLTLGYVPPPRTAVRGVMQVAPGHFFRCRLDASAQVHSEWWSANISPDESLTLESAVDETETLLLDAVRKRLQSERPLGVFLSGGVDSSLVAAAAVRTSSTPVKTFSIGFGDPKFDETRFAERVARELRTEHTTFRADEFAREITDTLPEVLDQPFADSSIIPTMLLSRMAREHVVVALGGDGGDEMFGGYVRYRAVPAIQRFQRVPGAMQLGARARVPLSVALGSRRADRLAGAMVSYPSLQARYLATMAKDANLVTNAAREVFKASWSRQIDLAPSHQLREIDFSTYLPGDILFKADIASMAFGLELRSPLLDRRLSAFALSLPASLAYSNSGKPVLKRLAQRWIPGFDANRPKMGFGIPPQMTAAPLNVTSGPVEEGDSWTRFVLENWRRQWLERPVPGPPDAGAKTDAST